MGRVNEAGVIDLVLSDVRPESMTELDEVIAHTVPTCPVLQLTEQRVTSAMQDSTHCACGMVVVEHRIHRRERLEREGAYRAAVALRGTQLRAYLGYLTGFQLARLIADQGTRSSSRLAARRTSAGHTTSGMVMKSHSLASMSVRIHSRTACSTK